MYFVITPLNLAQPYALYALNLYPKCFLTKLRKIYIIARYGHKWRKTVRKIIAQLLYICRSDTNSSFAIDVNYTYKYKLFELSNLKIADNTTVEANEFF
jgi:hypothetical protein